MSVSDTSSEIQEDQVSTKSPEKTEEKTKSGRPGMLGAAEVLASATFDADGVPSASSVDTNTLDSRLQALGNAASKITTPVTNLDFAHVLAE